MTAAKDFTKPGFKELKADSPGLGPKADSHSPWGDRAQREGVLSPDLVDRALSWLDDHGAEPLPWTRLTAEPGSEHGRGIDAILQMQGADLITRLIGILVCSQPIPDEKELVECMSPPPGLSPEGLSTGVEFAGMLAGLLDDSSRLLSLSLGQPDNSVLAGRRQAETLRRMTMAMARDVRVVMVRLASGLQTLRRLVAGAMAEREAAHSPAIEALTVLAPLANRLGLYQLKWEMEDLAFRCSQPEVYYSLARQLESKRLERERFVAGVTAELDALLRERGVSAKVSGRPKHLYSIHNKLLNKQLKLDRLHDLRGLRVLVETLPDCYAALDVVHQRWEPEPREFDDYIAKPKPNGYQSLHTVVVADDGMTLEVQIRTRAMHEQAEYGVAAHWRYKERAGAVGGSAGGGGAGGASASADQSIRLAWLRQLLAWQQDVGVRLGPEAVRTSDDSRIFVMTPQGRVIELPAGATPVDFAYHVHSTLGHRCRGAKVDGRMVPLNMVLVNGQVVEITAARDVGSGATAPGPSRDWLNPALGYLKSHRARSKVRQWFNARERDAESAASFALPGGVAAPKVADPGLALPGGEARPFARSGSRQAGSTVLVVGVNFLLTQLARCCYPVPPDPIIGFVTRGKGVTIHRAGCASFGQLSLRSPERVLAASWGEWDRPARSKRGQPTERRYPVAIQVHASDRPGLLRDITEAFARERINMLSVRSNMRSDLARFNFIVEVVSAIVLNRVLAVLGGIAGVQSCSRG